MKGVGDARKNNGNNHCLRPSRGMLGLRLGNFVGGWWAMHVLIFTMVLIDRRVIGPYSSIIAFYHSLHGAHLATRHK